MDSKVTLSFNTQVINRAKKYAADHNISLSRLIEHLLRQATSPVYKSLEDYPVSEWVNQLAEGEVEYQTKRSRKASKKEFFEAKK